MNKNLIKLLIPITLTCFYSKGIASEDNNQKESIWEEDTSDSEYDSSEEIKNTKISITNMIRNQMLPIKRVPEKVSININPETVLNTGSYIINLPNTMSPILSSILSSSKELLKPLMNGEVSKKSKTFLQIFELFLNNLSSLQKISVNLSTYTHEISRDNLDKVHDEIVKFNKKLKILKNYLAVLESLI